MATVNEMVASAVDYCINDALAPEAAADKAFVEDDWEAVRLLAVAGLGQLVGKTLHSIRGRAADGHSEDERRSGNPRSGRYQFATDASEAAAAYYWLNKPYGTSDGHTRPITDHTPEDVSYNKSIAARRASGWAARSVLWLTAQQALASRPRAKTVGDLPKSVLVELNRMAGEAFSGAVVV